MLDYIDLGAVRLHETDWRMVTGVEGLLGMPAPRESRRERTEAHGATDRSRWLGDKVITIEGECWGPTFSAARAEFAAVEAALYATLRAPGLLRWAWADGGLELQQRVKLAGDLAPPIKGGARLLTYQAMLRAADPRAYGQVPVLAQTSTLSGGAGGLVFPLAFPFAFNVSSSGGEAVIVLPGDRESAPVLRLYGYLKDPIVRLVTTGEEVRLIGEIAAGDYIEVRDRRLKLNAVAPRMNLLDARNTTFFDLDPGQHALRLFVQGFDAQGRVEVEASPAYGG